MKKRRIFRKTLIALGVIFLILQFIRPTRNNGEVHGKNDITKVVEVPADVEGILVKACYDCHSNSTNYPFYTNIQPIGWWMQDHVDEGKAELNFSEFKNYKLKRQIHKLEEAAEMVEEDEMPLDSYTWTHGDLSTEEKEVLIKWVKEAIVELKTQHK